MVEVIEQEVIKENDLPDAVNWDNIAEKPESLKDLSITDYQTLIDARDKSNSAVEITSGLDIQGWTFSGSFYSSGAQGVVWTGGTMQFKSVSYAISSGSATIATNTPTYFYFDKANPSNFLYTTTPSAAVGKDKVLVAVAQGNSDSSKNSVITVFGGGGGSTYVGTGNIANGSVNGSIIAARTILAQNIASGAITANEIAANTITTNQLNATAIDGMTITGALIRTASGGARTQLNSSSNSLEVYDYNYLRMRAYQQGLTFWDSSGQYVADIYAGTSGGLLITTANSGSSYRSIFLNAGNNGSIGLQINSNPFLTLDGQNNRMNLYKDIFAIGGPKLGDSAYSFSIGYISEIYTNKVGHVYGYGGANFLPSHASVSKLGTGRYQVSGSFSFNYVVNVQVLASTAKLCSVESKSSSSFVVRITNFSGSLEDNDFMFSILNYN